MSAADSEWLEPVQICCAFECTTTLLLLAPAAATAAQMQTQLAELADLGIHAVHGVQRATSAFFHCCSIAEADALVRAHQIVLSV